MSRHGTHRLDIYAEKILAGDPSVVAPPGAGSIVQQVVVGTSAPVGGGPITASIPTDDSIPQISEGGQVMSIGPITPVDAANNIVRVVANIMTSSAQVGGECSLALFNSQDVDALTAQFYRADTANFPGTRMLFFQALWSALVGSAPFTFTVRLGNNDAITNVDINSSTPGTRFFGAIDKSHIIVEERRP